MPTSIRLDADTERRLEDLARRTGQTKAWYIRQAVKAWLDEWEDDQIAIPGWKRKTGRSISPR